MLGICKIRRDVMQLAGLIKRWLGESIDDIANSYREPVQPEEVLEWMSDEQTKLAHEIVKGIINRAQSGDVQAVEWLVREGFVKQNFGFSKPLDIDKIHSLSDIPGGHSTRDGC